MDTYRDLFENNTCSMLLIDPTNGSILDVNKQAVKFYGYDKEEFTRMQIFDINAANMKLTAKDMIGAFYKKKNYFIFKHVLKSGEIKDVEAHSGPIELEIRGRKRNLLFSTIIDITEKMQAIRELNGLKDIISICANCKNIKIENEGWMAPEQIFGDIIKAEFSSGICPTCVEELYGDEVDSDVIDNIKNGE